MKNDKESQVLKSPLETKKFAKGETEFEITSHYPPFLKISSRQSVLDKHITSLFFSIEDAKQLCCFLRKVMNNEYHRSKEQKYWAGKRAFFWLDDERELGPLCLQSDDHKPGDHDGSVKWIYLSERLSRDLFLFLNKNIEGVKRD